MPPTRPDPATGQDAPAPAGRVRCGSPQPSAVRDLLAPDLRLVLVGINPGRVSAAAAAHFANPRNDFWRLLEASGLTPELLGPERQAEVLDLGIGITNAARADDARDPATCARPTSRAAPSGSSGSRASCVPR